MTLIATHTAIWTAVAARMAMVAIRWRAARPVVTGLAGVLYTIPSLAATSCSRATIGPGTGSARSNRSFTVALQK